jgi:hypothetical protein
MPRICCQKPLTKIINVVTFGGGIVGFEDIMKDLAKAEWSGERELATQLLAKARERGNYVAHATEEPYKVALLREFRLFVGKGAQGK